MAGGGSLGSLVINLAADISRFESALTKAEHLADKKSNAISKNIKRMAIGVGAAIASFGFVNAVKSSLEFADSIGKAADRAGIGTTKLQEMRFAADQFGISVQQIDDGMRRFTRRLGVALDGGSFAKDFSELGVAIRDSNGNIRSSEAVLDDVTRAMGGLESAAQKSKVAAQLFGDDTGPQLALLLGQGQSAIDELAGKARSLGLIMDEDLIRNSEKANDEMSALAQVIKIEFVSAIVQAAPLIESAAKAIIETIQSITRAYGDVAKLSSDQVSKKIDEISEQIIAAQERLQEAQRREDSNALKDVLLDQVLPSSETIQARITSLEADLQAAVDVMQGIQLRDSDTKIAELRNPLTGMTDEELKTSNENVINEMLWLSARTREIDDIVARERMDAIEDVADFRVQTEKSSVQNGIALLQVFGRSSKKAALAALAIEKGLAIATAIAGTQAAMAKSRIIDPTGALAAKIGIEGALNVATIAALGLAQASQINKAASGSSPTGSVTDPFSVQGQQPIGQATPTQNGSITFNINGVVTKEIVYDLIIPGIQDAVDNHDVIIINSQSRNAKELAA